MKTSYRQILNIAAAEACVLVRYDDKGAWAIGFGHRDATLTENSKITVEEAIALLQKDLAKYEARVSSAIKVELTQNEFDALVDFDLNTGAIIGGSVDDKINAGDKKGAMDILEQYVKAQGKKLNGLVARRALERQTFEKGTYGPTPKITLYRGDPTKTAPEKLAFPSEDKLNGVVVPVPVVAPVVVSTPISFGPGQYLIQPLDTLYSIAKKNGITVDVLKELNKLESDKILAGGILKVLPEEFTPPPPPPPKPSIITSVFKPVPVEKRYNDFSAPWIEPATPGWRGTVGLGLTADEVEKYLATLTFSNFKPVGVVLHNTDTPNLDRWKATPGGIQQRLKNTTPGYKAQHWSSGPHFFNDDQYSWVYTCPNVRGTHSPSFNGTHWGVEMVGNFDIEPFNPAIKEVTVNLLAVLFKFLKKDPAKLIFHKEDPKTTHKHCPGVHVVKTEIIDLVKQRMK